MAFRMLVLESHYHSESNFSWEILSAAQNRINNWASVYELVWQLPENDDYQVIESINKRLADDFNTPLALKDIDAYFEKTIKQNKSPNNKVLAHIEIALGISIENKDITKDLKLLLKKREEARKAKNWELSDNLRDELKDKDIIVRDDAVGQIWSRNNHF
jgi:cysteinyl-tRNA synthetase